MRLVALLVLVASGCVSYQTEEDVTEADDDVSDVGLESVADADADADAWTDDSGQDVQPEAEPDATGDSDQESDDAVGCIPGVEINCGGVCVQGLTDPLHCGGCRVVCDTTAGQFCDEGACRCPPGSHYCEAVPGATEATCTDWMSDDDHCGGCSQGCTALDACYEAACRSRCPTPGETNCTLALMGYDCHDVNTDPLHCGSCRNACDDDAPVCRDGVCVSS